MNFFSLYEFYFLSQKRPCFKKVQSFCYFIVPVTNDVNVKNISKSLRFITLDKINRSNLLTEVKPFENHV